MFGVSLNKNWYNIKNLSILLLLLSSIIPANPITAAKALIATLHIAEFHGEEYKPHSHHHHKQSKDGVSPTRENSTDDHEQHHIHVCSHDTQWNLPVIQLDPSYSCQSGIKSQVRDTFDSTDHLQGIFRPPITAFS